MVKYPSSKGLGRFDYQFDCLVRRLGEMAVTPVAWLDAHCVEALRRARAARPVVGVADAGRSSAPPPPSGGRGALL